jgi:hypothetical protein
LRPGAYSYRYEEGERKSGAADIVHPVKIGQLPVADPCPRLRNCSIYKLPGAAF